MMQTSAAQPKAIHPAAGSDRPAHGPLWLRAAPIAGAVIAYILTSTVRFQNTLPWFLFNFVLWGGAAALSYVAMRRRGSALGGDDRSLLLIAGLAAAFHIAMMMIAANFFGGFGRSPYRDDALGLLLNALYVATMVAGLELSRAATVGALKERRPVLAFALGTLLFAVLSTPFGQFTGISGVANFIQQGGEVFLPALAQSMLATYLVMSVGPLAGIVYHGVLMGFEFFSPILPDVEWLITAFVGTLVPACGLWVIQGWLEDDGEAAGEEAEGEKGVMGWWIAVGVISLAMLWFNMGVFGVQPTMITGPSMEPTMVMGDLAIVKTIAAEEVEVGDIIRFRYNGVHVLHRVIDVQNEDGQIVFTTQGDNNNVADDPISPDQLEGKVVLVIPKIGLLSVGLRRVFAWRG